MLESEHSLLQRFARTNDSEAFSEIVRRHAGLVYGACLRILADKDRASDAVQDTFFQLLRSAHGITGSLPNWLHRVAIRKAIDTVRRDSSRKQREIRYTAGRPHEVTKWQDLSPYIDEVLEELDDGTRDILVQHFFEGQTATDIAGKQGISQPTVSRMIESGVARLRDKLRSRGIIVAVAGLATLLVENAAQAAPAVVLKELGKMALVGTTTASVSGAGAGAKAIAGGVLTGVKAKIITAAAVAALGVGSVVTYQQLTAPTRPSDSTVTEELERPSRRRQRAAEQRERPARMMPAIEQQPQELMDAPAPIERKAAADSKVVEPKPETVMGVPDQTGNGDSPPDTANSYAVGLAGAAPGPGGETDNQNNQSPDANAPAEDAGYGGYFVGARVAVPGDPNIPDINFPSDER